MLKTPGLCSYHTDRQVSCLVCSGSVGTADPGTDPNRVPGAMHASARVSGIGAARRHASEQRIRRQRRYRSMVFTWRVAVLAGPTVNARSAFFPANIGPTSSAEQRQASAPQAGQGAPRWPAEGGGGVGPGVARGGPRVGTRTSGGSRADRAPSVETMNGSTYSGRVQGRRTRRNLSVTLTLFYPHSR
jgi:hypothetical protein